MRHDLSYVESLRDTWIDVYLRSDNTLKDLDLHQLFADRINKSRQDAKQLCYEVQYTIPFMARIIKDLTALEKVHEALQESSFSEE